MKSIFFWDGQSPPLGSRAQSPPHTLPLRRFDPRACTRLLILESGSATVGHGVIGVDGQNRRGSSHTFHWNASAVLL